MDLPESSRIVKKKIYCSILDLKNYPTLMKKTFEKFIECKKINYYRRKFGSSSIKNIFFDIKNKFNHSFKIDLFNIDKNYMFGSSSRKYIWKTKGLSPDYISRKLIKQIK